MSGLLFGLLGGAIRCLLGWQAAMQKDAKTSMFSWGKTLVTLTLGALAGLAAQPIFASLGVGVVTDGLTIFIGAAAPYFIEDVFPLLRKRLIEKLPLNN